jgi:serine/threonine protein kinase
MLDSVDYTQTGVGTPLYFSPEICKGDKYNYKTDMWMLGCLLYELCELRRPFVSESINALIDKIINTEPNAMMSSYTPELKKLISNLLIKNPEDRWGIRDIYKYETFSKYLTKFTKHLSTKLIDINKLKITIDEDVSTPKNITRDIGKKLTPSHCKSDVNKIIRNLRMSPRLSPLNQKLEITEINLTHQDMNEPKRKISTNSCSTTTTSELKLLGLPKPVKTLKLNNKSHYKHISINISSCQSPDNKATYKVENIEKIEEIEFPKSQIKIQTPTNTIPKRNSFELKDIPRSTKVKSNKRYDNNIIKQFLIDKYGFEKYTKMYNSIIENDNKLNEEMIKDIVGEDYSDALNYAKYMIEYDNI